MNHIAIKFLSTGTVAICCELVVILLNVLKHSFFYVPLLVLAEDHGKRVASSRKLSDTKGMDTCL